LKKFNLTKYITWSTVTCAGFIRACPEYTAEVDGIGTLLFLMLLKNRIKNAFFTRLQLLNFYGISCRNPPRLKRLRFYPRSPYAAAKLYAYWIVINYREAV